MIRWAATLVITGAAAVAMAVAFVPPRVQEVPQAQEQTAPAPLAKKLTEPFGQDMVVSAIHKYLDASLRDSTRARQTYWKSLRRADGTLDLERARADLRQALGAPDDCLFPASPALLDRATVTHIEEGTIERWTMTVCAGLTVTGLIGRLQGLDKAPLVIAMHGTNATPERVFGIEDSAEVEGKDYHHSFARRLMARGFIVFAPMLITETRTDPLEGYNKTRNVLNQRALPLGLSINGMQIAMLSAVLPLLLHESGANPERVAVYGISHGGQLAFYLAALDTRIRAAVISQWFEERASKLSGDEHPHALWRYHNTGHNFYSGMLLRFTDLDVARLIAPRGLFIETGLKDGPRAESAAATFPKLLALYRETGSPDGATCIELTRDAGHEIVMNKAALFLDRWLFDRPMPSRSYCPLAAEP